MIRRLILIVALAYVAGFGLFLYRLPGPTRGVTTDAIVVLTGGRGRIDRGAALLREGAARRMFVSGVPIGVTPADLARENHVPAQLFRCCIDLGTAAVDTRSNAQETADWVREHGYRSIRLVTSDWHMARARMELDSALGPALTIVPDGVPSQRRTTLLLLREYNKLLLRRIALWTGVGG